MSKYKNILYGLLMFLVIAACCFLYFVCEDRCCVEEQSYIAHAGGEIDGYTYTNSKEAVEHSIECGMKYIELDLLLTSDSSLVAAHSWADYNKMVGVENLDSIPTLEQFQQSKLLGKYTPLTFADIDSILCVNPDIVLVTDKMSNPAIIDACLGKYKERVIVECKTDEDYYFYMDHGYKMSMYRNGKYLISQFIQSVVRRLQGKKDRYSACVIYKGDQDKIHCDCKFVYTCRDRHEADSIFSQYNDVKFVYIDNVE